MALEIILNNKGGSDKDIGPKELKHLSKNTMAFQAFECMFLQARPLIQELTFGSTRLFVHNFGPPSKSLATFDPVLHQINALIN